MIYTCYVCGKAVEDETHFTADDGRILCEEHAQGVEPCDDRVKLLYCHDLTDGAYYYFYKFDIFLKAKILKVEHFKDQPEPSTHIEFENGHIDIYKDSKVTAYRRPSNIIADFKYCYEIKDTYGDHIGWIAKPSE